MTARLSIVIVSYNARGDLDRCLQSLAVHRPSTPHEIVVVDNASTDGSAALVRTQWPAVRLIDAGANVGFARANNMAIRRTAAELILLLNGDTVVKAGTIDTLVQTLDRHADIAVVGPRIVDGDGRPELSFGRMIGPFAEARQKVLVLGNDRRIGPVTAYVERATRRARDVDWVSGACLLVRRADAESVGLLDERYFMYADDVDFCASRPPRRARRPPPRPGPRPPPPPRGGGRAGGGGGGPPPPRRHGSRVPPRPPRLLRKASSGMGPRPSSVPMAQGTIAR
jgi:GT2 family glycosyltransferase